MPMIKLNQPPHLRVESGPVKITGNNAHNYESEEYQLNLEERVKNSPLHKSLTSYISDTLNKSMTPSDSNLIEMLEFQAK